MNLYYFEYFCNLEWAYKRALLFAPDKKSARAELGENISEVEFKEITEPLVVYKQDTDGFPYNFDIIHWPLPHEFEVYCEE